MQRKDEFPMYGYIKTKTYKNVLTKRQMVLSTHNFWHLRRSPRRPNGRNLVMLCLQI